MSFCQNQQITENEKVTIDRLSHEMNEKHRAWIQSPDLWRACLILKKYFHINQNQKTIILCPNVRDARFVAKHLSVDFCVTGEEDNKERFIAWETFRSQKKCTTVSTRVGLFLCDATTTTVIVLRSGHPNHVEHNRNPRIDTREICKKFSEKFATNLFFLDVFPRADDLHSFSKENLLWYYGNPSVKFVNPSVEKFVSDNPVIVSTTAQEISDTLNHDGKILVILNKKGYAAKIRCQDCNDTFVCQTCGRSVRVEQSTIACKHCASILPIPTRCPSCKSVRLVHRGYAIGRVTELFRKMFPSNLVSTLDAESKSMDNLADVTITTKAFLENFFDPNSCDKFDCVVYLDADSALFSSHFRATEYTAWSFFEWLSVARASKARFIVQTEESAFFSKILSEPEEFLKNELNQRALFNQPPFEKWIHIDIRELDQKKREWEWQIIKQELEKISGVKTTKNFVIRVPLESFDQTMRIFSKLEDKIIIDTNAFS